MRHDADIAGALEGKLSLGHLNQTCRLVGRKCKPHQAIGACGHKGRVYRPPTRFRTRLNGRE